MATVERGSEVLKPRTEGHLSMILALVAFWYWGKIVQYDIWPSVH